MFRYAYPQPTEWHWERALLTNLPLGYSLVKTCGEEGREKNMDVWILLKGSCLVNEYSELKKETNIF